MRLFLYCHHCSSKVHLESTAITRSNLASKWEDDFYIKCPHCANKRLYNVNEVYAEKSSSNAVGGAIIGGLLGALIGGPIGALTGSTIGGGGGYVSDENDYNKVLRFNNS